MRPLRQFIGRAPARSVSSRPMKDAFHVPQVSRGQAYAMLGGAALMMTLAMGIRQNLGLFQEQGKYLSAIMKAGKLHKNRLN